MKPQDESPCPVYSNAKRPAARPKVTINCPTPPPYVVWPTGVLAYGAVVVTQGPHGSYLWQGGPGGTVIYLGEGYPCDSLPVIGTGFHFVTCTGQLGVRG